MISVCVAAHRVHREPNLTTLAGSMPRALGGLEAELIVTLNGLGREVCPPGTRTVSFERNRGVAPGWNAAAAVATGDVLVFTNDDVVLGPDSLRRVSGALSDLSTAGAVGAAEVRMSESPSRHGEPVASQWGPLRPVSAVAGYLMAVRAHAFREVGGFDEAYAPCLWEDADLCFALRERLGLGSYVLGDLDVDHAAGISGRRAWPWVRVQWDQRSETLWSIRRRNRRRLLAKWV